MNDIDALLRDLKKYGTAGRDCALSAEDALTIVAALEAAREDVERLDALNAMVLESDERALLLHHGMHKRREPSFCGLGLSNTGRTLRQAIDQSRGKGAGDA